MAAAKLTEAEWSVMDALWERGELTGREAAELLRERCGWSRSTVLTLLGRMEAKGAVSGESEGGVKVFRPLISREDAAVAERAHEETGPAKVRDRRALRAAAKTGGGTRWLSG